MIHRFVALNGDWKTSIELQILLNFLYYFLKELWKRYFSIDLDRIDEIEQSWLKCEVIVIWNSMNWKGMFVLKF